MRHLVATLAILAAAPACSRDVTLAVRDGGVPDGASGDTAAGPDGLDGGTDAGTTDTPQDASSSLGDGAVACAASCVEPAPMDCGPGAVEAPTGRCVLVGEQCTVEMTCQPCTEPCTTGDPVDAGTGGG